MVQSFGFAVERVKVQVLGYKRQEWIEFLGPCWGIVFWELVCEERKGMRYTNGLKVLIREIFLDTSCYNRSGVRELIETQVFSFPSTPIVFLLLESLANVEILCDSCKFASSAKRGLN